MRMEPHTDRAPAASASARPRPAADGILLVDKPVNLTSHGVVARLRRWLKLDKVGHCGTLDPFATGVLVICVNQATRISEHLLVQDKHYRFTVRFGVRTDTQDCTGQVTETYDGPPLPESELDRLLPGFSGTFEQRVPRFAAVKINGKPLYAYARQGRSVDLPTRVVTIHQLKLLDYSWPEAVLEVISSKGTYIRQLADDLGQALGCGAHVSALTRLASGSYTLEQATALEEFRSMRADSSWQERLIPLHAALTHLPQAVIEEEPVMRGLRNGQLPGDWEARQRKRIPLIRGPVRLVAGDGQLLGLWWPNPDKGQRRLRIFKPLP
jgi:tRNA pseudouridine55 synthase